MRRRISGLVLVTTSAVVIAFVIPLCMLVRTLAEDRAMADADHAARLVSLAMATGATDAQLARSLPHADGSPRVAVLTPAGRTLGTAEDLRSDPLVRRALVGAEVQEQTSRGGVVYQPVVTRRGTGVVRAVATAAEMRAGVYRAWLWIVLLAASLLLVSWLIARQFGRAISDPVVHLSDTAHRLREGALDARAEVRGTPETEELARALNGLADRTRELLAAERNSVGDLSHRLRTPVTALRLDVETVTDAKAAAQLQHHVAVLQRTVDAIVKEARRPVRSDLPASCDASLVVAERARFWGALAEDGGRALVLALDDDPLPVPVAADDLGDVIDALVDNVFAHTPEGTPFRIELSRVPDGAQIVISDRGPGWAKVREERVGHTGLGLDIAGRTARGCGGTFVRTREPDGGARVEVTLPLVAE